jgi:diacylglycerol O-acyltransferase / wax synthase
MVTATSNITVSFTALSYAGQLTVTLTSDPEACPDDGRLQRLLQGELDGLTTTLRPSGPES